MMGEEKAMRHPIETNRQPDGSWVATAPQVPGLTAYGQSREEVLVQARKLCAILLEEHVLHNHRILAFFPGKIPDSYRPECSI